MARIVGVHRTTISRELKRNRSPNGYYPQAASITDPEKHWSFDHQTMFLNSINLNTKRTLQS
ncbi:MAG TPA: hypothetical protein EYG11_16970 [Candidatus Latescibacteria bacterium]|nr:hypothetical protein [Candidatus Latescibacterota bacterium]